MTTPKRGRWHPWLVGDIVLIEGEDPNESWKILEITKGREFADVIAICGWRMGSLRFVRVETLMMLKAVEKADDNTSS